MARPPAATDGNGDQLATEQADYAARRRPETPFSRSLLVRILVPLAVGLGFFLAWEACVRIYEIRPFVLPAPSAIAEVLADREVMLSLLGSWWITFRVTVQAFLLALVGGVLLAVLFSLNRVVELALFPYAVILQVTPVVSIAPLVIIWVGFDNVAAALLILAWIVAFFPILSNTTMGLRSVDHNLINLFELYGAGRWQVLWRLQLPAALPYVLAGMKISGGLALIGVVVAEFVAGSGGTAGLAWRIIESGNRLQIPRMFAALLLMSATGVGIFFFLHGLQYLLLRKWHESALKREN